jgi:hypothetical protein
MAVRLHTSARATGGRPRESAGEELRQVDREGGGGGGDGGPETDREGGPAGEEAPDRTEGAAQVDVLAAHTGQGGPELRIRQRSGQGEHGAGDPESEDRERVAQIAGQEAARREDSAADGVGDEETGGRERADPAQRLVSGHREPKA